MTDSSFDDCPLYLIILISVIYVIFMPISDIFAMIIQIIIIIGVFAGIIFSIFKYLDRKRTKEKPIIKEIIENFIDKAINELERDELNSEWFEFPDSLLYYFGISTDMDAFRKFSKRAKRLRRKIKKYNKYCDIINDKITKLSNKAKKQGLIESSADVHLIVKTDGEEGYSLDWSGKYEELNQKDKNKLIEEHDLKKDIREIIELKKGLPNKIDMLSKKLKDLKIKWIDIYLITSNQRE